MCLKEVRMEGTGKGDPGYWSARNWTGNVSNLAHSDVEIDRGLAAKMLLVPAFQLIRFRQTRTGKFGGLMDPYHQTAWWRRYGTVVCVG